MENYAITVVNQTFVGNVAEPFFDVVTFLATLDQTATADVVGLKKLAAETQLTPAYNDGMGNIVTEKVMKVLDVYELIDDINFTGNPEVNSRQIVPAKAMDLAEFITTFYSDYVFEDDMQA